MVLWFYTDQTRCHIRASALSFMFENLDKPIIFTGSQLPIGRLRTDAKENLITSVEIAAAKNDIGNAMFHNNYSFLSIDL